MKTLITQYGLIVNQDKVLNIDIDLKFGEFHELEVILIYTQNGSGQAESYDYFINLNSATDPIGEFLQDILNDFDAQKYVTEVIANCLATQDVVKAMDIIQILKAATERGDFETMNTIGANGRAGRRNEF